MTTNCYPNINWATFAYCNENPTSSFEDMTRRLFTEHYLNNCQLPHSDHATPGIEVLPILEPPHKDGSPQRRISFQSKYFEQSSVDYRQIQDSAKQTVKHFKGQVDLVYLFCNKTISTTNSGFKKAATILSSANIFLQPVSNSELLDLIVKYPDIFNYYFRLRNTPCFSSLPIMPCGLIASNLSQGTPVFPPTNQQQLLDLSLLKTLIADKSRLCRNHVCSLKYDELNRELDTILENNIDGIDGAETLYFYKLLACLHSGADYKIILEKFGKEYKRDVEWLITFFNTPRELRKKDIDGIQPETQLFAIEKLFSLRFWDNVISLYAEMKENVPTEIQTSFELLYGLALFNLQRYDESCDIFQALFEKEKESKYQLYFIFSSIRKESVIFQTGCNGNSERLSVLLDKLDSFNELNQYKQEELLIAILKLEAFCHLGRSDKDFLDRAIDAYSGFSEQVRGNSIVRYYYALSLELNGNRKEAANVYASLDWKTDPNIAERYMVCLILNGEPEKAKDVFLKIDSANKSSKTTSIYLLAIERSGEDTYKDELKKAVNENKHSIEDLFQIAYYVDEITLLKTLIMPYMRELLTDDAINKLPLYRKIEIITVLSHCDEIELVERILKYIPNLSAINFFTVGEIYQSLYRVANREYLKNEKQYPMPTDFQAADRIADSFINAGVSNKLFLQIKVMTCGATHLSYSMLKYAKALFEITHDEATARIIISQLLARKETRLEQYSPYLECLTQTENPEHCMMVASAMLILGREENAEYYAYKALYLLDSRDDFEIYKSYFAFCNYNLHRYHNDEKKRIVRGSVVVSLEETNLAKENRQISICLDSETEFSDPLNHSMGISHFPSSNTDHIKLQGAGLGQIIRVQNRTYKVVEIISRADYGLRFVFRKIQEYPDMFKGFAWTISAQNIDEALEQIRALTDRTEHIKSLLRSYHFEDNPVGLPVEALVSGDYDKYVAALKYLLFQPNEAFYAGEIVFEDESSQKYVPDLSTLVFLSVLGRLDILSPIKNDLIIPQSYCDFCHSQYAKAVNMDQNSSSLYFIEGKPVLQESDKSIPEIWEAISTFCDDCEKASVSDDQRISFIIAENITGESIISGFHLSHIHLDALILASSEHMSFLCDDLFFRKVATWAGIRNLNTSSILLHYSDIDYLFAIILELSKTNYVYIPYIPLYANNEAEIIELNRNLLSGEKKEAYYTPIMQNYVDSIERIIKNLFDQEDSCETEQAAEEEKAILTEESTIPNE